MGLARPWKNFGMETFKYFFKDKTMFWDINYENKQDLNSMLLRCLVLLLSLWLAITSYKDLAALSIYFTSALD